MATKDHRTPKYALLSPLDVDQLRSRDLLQPGDEPGMQLLHKSIFDLPWNEQPPEVDFLPVPLYLNSVEALRHIGFTEKRAEELLRDHEVDNLRYLLSGYIQSPHMPPPQPREETDGEWLDCLNRIGLNDVLKVQIMIPDSRMLARLSCTTCATMADQQVGLRWSELMRLQEDSSGRELVPKGLVRPEHATEEELAQADSMDS